MGLGVVAAQNIEQAKAWMDEDPAVQAGFFANLEIPSTPGVRSEKFEDIALPLGNGFIE
jgi:hypothetical protein